MKHRLALCRGHSFDIAKQGYRNLLPVRNKRSLDPGDSKLMVAARRSFLELKGTAPFNKPKNHENGMKGLHYIPSVPLMPSTINGDNEY